MATAIQLQEQLKKLGVTLTGDENYKTLQKMLADAKTAKGGDTPKTGETPTPSGKEVYVWLRNRAYVDDAGKKRIDGGLYVLALALFPRLAKYPKNVCEVFEGDVPPRKLAEIARWSGVNPDGREDAELLDILVKAPVTF